MSKLAWVGLMMLAFAGSAYAEAGPVLSDTGFDAKEFGASQGYPVPSAGPPLPRQMVGYYSHYDQVWPTRTVAQAGTTSVLKRAATEIAPHYTYHGEKWSILAYLDRNPVTGLLIARGDTILFEHYNYARTPQDRFLSQSMAKTITSLLVGIAVSEGAIHTIDDVAAAYVPELAGTAYGATSIRALLHMSSGVAYRETYQPGDDNEKLNLALFPPRAPGAVAAVKQFDRRDAPPGTRWNYASVETEVLGLVISRAVHMTLGDYLSTRIWTRMGMEAPAAWAVDRTGQEITYCCLIATLRDWARIGLMLAHDGTWNGAQIVPKQWLLDATTVAPADAYLAPGHSPGPLGYGYQVWLLPGGRRVFALRGIHGQNLFVDPVAKLVMVQTAVFKPATGPELREVFAPWAAVEAEYGGG